MEKGDHPSKCPADSEFAGLFWAELMKQVGCKAFGNSARKPIMEEVSQLKMHNVLFLVVCHTVSGTSVISVNCESPSIIKDL